MEWINDLLGNWQVIIVIITLLGGSMVTIIKSVKKAKKELEDVLKAYEEKKEGGFTQKELEEMFVEIKEAVQAVSESIQLFKSLWLKIKGKIKK